MQKSIQLLPLFEKFIADSYKGRRLKPNGEKIKPNQKQLKAIFFNKCIRFYENQKTMTSQTVNYWEILFW